MEDVFLKARIDENRSICISPLPSKTYKEAGGKGLGGEYGYFIYEVVESGIEIIGKAASIEAATRIFELLVSDAVRAEEAA